MSAYIDGPSFLRSLQEEMNRQMLAAAEPVIQKAVQEVERAMRQRLGAMVIGLIEKSVEVDRFGPDLRILVKQAKP